MIIGVGLFAFVGGWIIGFICCGKAVQADRRFYHCPDCGKEEIRDRASEGIGP